MSCFFFFFLFFLSFFQRVQILDKQKKSYFAGFLEGVFFLVFRVARGAWHEEFFFVFSIRGGEFFSSLFPTALTKAELWEVITKV